MTTRGLRLCLAAVSAAVVSRAYPALAQEMTPDSLLKAGVTLTWDVRIPLRDGTSLSATMYQSKHDKTPVPAIFWMTPYIADMSHSRGMYFARNGYVYLNIDTRGRGNSTGAGKFEPFAHEKTLGYDITEWLAKQPFTNGKVATWGGSYGGFYQWATASQKPPHLLSMAPVASAHPGVDFPFLRNIFRTYMIQWSTYTSGAAAQTNLFGDGKFWGEKYADRYFNHRAHASLDTILQRTARHRNRPLLAVDDPEERIRTLYAAREPIYKQSGTVILTDSRPLHDIIAHVIRAWKRDAVDFARASAAR